MDTKLTQTTDTTKLMAFDYFAFAEELPYLQAAGLQYTIIEQSPGSNYVQISLTISTPYDLQMFAQANKTYVMNCLSQRRVAA